MDFAAAEKAFWEQIGPGMYMVLATADNNNVTARTVNMTQHKGKLLFLTFADSVKYAQIQTNPQVAVCSGCIALKGKATILGPVDAPASAEALAATLAAFPDDMQHYSTQPGAVMVEFVPQSGTYLVNDSLMRAMDFVTRAYREFEV